jgi:hypothetical protein
MPGHKVMKLWTVLVSAFMAVLAALGFASTATAAASVQQHEESRNCAAAPAAAKRPAPAPRTSPQERTLPPTMKQRIAAEAHGASPSCRALPPGEGPEDAVAPAARTRPAPQPADAPSGATRTTTTTTSVTGTSGYGGVASTTRSTTTTVTSGTRAPAAGTPAARPPAAQAPGASAPRSETTVAVTGRYPALVMAAIGAPRSAGTTPPDTAAPEQRSAAPAEGAEPAGTVPQARPQTAPVPAHILPAPRTMPQAHILPAPRSR